jgi:hypothetical protein
LEKWLKNNLKQMGNVISLTPGFSRVKTGQSSKNRFNGFSRWPQAVETARLPEYFHHPAEAGW